VTAVQQSLPDMGPRPLVAGPVFICFELLGTPGHKGRHRSRIVTPKAGRPFIHNYPDPETERYEGDLRQVATLYMRGRKPAYGPLALLVHAFRAVPASWKAKDKEAALAGAIMPTSKPDWDNYGKIVDALNGVLWRDDAQICDGRVIKVYAHRPALRIEVREFIPAIP
jgi:Holliday junction resolvase RusA-like endonuclease